MAAKTRSSSNLKRFAFEARPSETSKDVSSSRIRSLDVYFKSVVGALCNQFLILTTSGFSSASVKNFRLLLKFSVERNNLRIHLFFKPRPAGRGFPLNEP